MKKKCIGKRKITFLMALVIMLTMLWIPDVRMKAEDTFSLSGMAHVQSKGDTDGVWAGNVLKLGTTGQGKRLEAITINFKNNTQYEGSMQYRVHRQTYGWTSWVNAGEQAGTTGQGKRLEAIEIKLTGELAKHYSVKYRVHAQTYGWNQGWQYDGALAGTTGEAKRLECLEIQIVPREENMNLSYRVHRQTFGWEKKWLTNGQISGTTGQSKRLEGITIALTGNKYSGSVHYRTHVQSYGWMDTVKDGTMSGTQGEAKRLEAIEIALSGDMARHYDIYYRVHSQTYGWLGWAKNGEPAGTAGGGKRLEAIQIVLVDKQSNSPSLNYSGVESSSENAYINISGVKTEILSIPDNDDQQNEDVSKDEEDDTYADEQPEYSLGDHVHIWEAQGGQYKNGYACNNCYNDITDYEDLYGCCGGWHTHSWCYVPNHYKCTICGVKVHRHNWIWNKPEYATGTDKVITEGHYFCWGCYKHSWEGGVIDDEIFPYAWKTDFYDDSEYIMEVAHTDQKDYTLNIDTINIDDTVICMEPGDTQRLNISFTPSNTTDDRTIKWESDNPSVVSVDELGNIKACGIGTATITAIAINGVKDTSFIRVMETNVGKVTSAKIYVDGVDVTDKTFSVKANDCLSIEIVTTPEKAVYEVRYSSLKLNDEDGYAVSPSHSAKGGVSEWGWQNGVEYTDSASEIHVYRTSVSSEITATITDMQGNTIVLKTQAIVK